MDENRVYFSYINQTYEELCVLNKNDKVKTILAQNKETGKIVVKKYVHSVQGGIYQQLKGILHPNLIQIHDVCYTAKGCTIIQDFVSGQTLEELIYYKKVIPVKEALCYIEQILNGLQAIHKCNIIHRDLSPQNILISTDGVIKLLDFGIARYQKENQHKDTTILGTVGYASPEQFGFQQTDVRTDIYAVGILINKMLTGKMPDEELVLDEKLQKIVSRCIQIDPEKRYASVEILQKELGFLYEEREEIKEEKEVKKVKEDLSVWPGFRSGVRWRKIIGAIGYAGMFLIMIISVEDVKNGGIQAMLMAVAAYCIYTILTFLILSNFARWDRKILFFRKMPKELAIATRVILSFLSLDFGIMLDNYARYTMAGLIK